MSEDVTIGVVPITDDNRAPLTRLAITMRISGTTCPVCHHKYSDYEDIMTRNPKAGVFLESVCVGCWDKYVDTVHNFCEQIPRSSTGNVKNE